MFPFDMIDHPTFQDEYILAVNEILTKNNVKVAINDQASLQTLENDLKIDLNSLALKKNL